MYLPAESSDSLDYKETPANVAMSASQLGGEYAYCSSLADESESAFMDDVESDSSETGSANTNSDSSETQLDKDEEINTLSTLGRALYAAEAYRLRHWAENGARFSFTFAMEIYTENTCLSVFSLSVVCAFIILSSSGSNLRGT
ncbi:hypothetical protein RJT34_30634 [Clitoria ternatea]|uniref:Uncharacterized protein n=1 Tax=Clitoria ternatea TaxID=43366 RepID=A0AAN9I485_CLITE